MLALIFDETTDAVLNLQDDCEKTFITEMPRKSGEQWKFNFMNARDADFGKTALLYVV